MKAFIERTLAWLLTVAVKGYRWVVSPVLTGLLGPMCRFTPSCSCYAEQALKTHSLPSALWLIAKRLGKCQPLGSHGFDPVPERKIP